jgi:deaminated glutathione amidase
VGSADNTPKSICKRARAIENLAYVVSANSAGIFNTAIPANSTDGMSCIVDYKGLTLIQAGYGESMVANATIDLRALRDWRKRPGMSNLLARQRTELFAESYANTPMYPANTLANTSASRAHFLQTQQQTIASLIERGILQ